jgi:lipopolysaccharide transport system ATP-binding protein
MGLTRREVAQHFESIIEFAELQGFIDNPLRTFSTGMRMRLAFAVATHVVPDILLIDEALSVGDVSFKAKCLHRITKFKANGCTIFFVSHDTTQIQRICDKVLWLRGGQLIAQGDPKMVVGKYVRAMTTETKKRTPILRSHVRTPTGNKLQTNNNRFGSLELEIFAVHLLDSDKLPITELDSGNPLYIEIEYLTSKHIKSPIFGVAISDEDRQVCSSTNTIAAGITLPTLHGRGKVTLHLERLDLKGGHYYVSVGVYKSDWTYAYDYHWQVYPLFIRSKGSSKGLLYPPHRWKLN